MPGRARTTGGRLASGLLAAAPLGVGIASCRGPTQLRVELSTDLPSDAVCMPHAVVDELTLWASKP